MRRWFLIPLALLIASFALAVNPPPVLVVKLSDEASRTARDQQAIPSVLASVDQESGLAPVFQPPGDPEQLAAWREFGLHRWFTVQSAGVGPTDIATQLSKNAEVLDFQLLEAASAHYIPDDMNNFNMWGLTRMQLPMAWDLQTGTDGILVSTIDTGCNLGHEDLSANIFVNWGEDVNEDGVIDQADENGVDDDGNGYADDFYGYDFVSHTYEPYGMIEGEDYAPRDNHVFPDVHGHGTHVAGSMAASTDNNVGVAAASFNVTQMPLRAGFAIEDGGDIYGIGYDDDFAPAVAYAAEMGARVISISFGGTGFWQGYQDAINYARSLGCVIFASAGNDNYSVLTYPAAYENVVAVAASDVNDERAWFSNFGNWIDITAPGVDIWSTMSNNVWHPVDYISWNGTSMASPNAASVAALILSANPGLSPSEVETILFESADNIDADNPGYEGQLGWGVVNAYNALMSMSGPLEVPQNLWGDLDGGTGEVSLGWDPVSGDVLDDFMGYVVYRNGEYVGEVPHVGFSDYLPGFGFYEYQVSAVYAEGESNWSDPLVVEWYGHSGDPVHFMPVERTGLPYAIVVDYAGFGEGMLMPGDEIGVFDGDLCVGAISVFGEPPYAITAWQSEPDQGMLGFIPGNPMRFEYFRAMEGQFIPASANYTTGNGSFGDGPYTVVELQDFDPQPEHFYPVERTGLPYAIVVDFAGFGEGTLMPGDEIGVFDGDLCVGAVSIHGDAPYPITVWQGDVEQELPGFTPGNPIHFEYFRAMEMDYYPAQATYTVGDGTFGAGPYSIVELEDFEVVPVHFSPVDRTGLPYAIVIDEAIMLEEVMLPGDEIAVFDGGLCVGAAVVRDGWPLALTAWQSDADHGLPGFVPGDGMQFHVWSASEDLEMPAAAEYSVGDGLFGSGPYSQVVLNADLAEPQETVVAANRFELVSMFVVPQDMSVEELFGSLDDLVVVYQDNGNFYVPNLINTIGAATPTEGYRVFVSTADTWTFEGAPMDPGSVYPLAAGRWNWMGFPYAETFGVQAAMGDIEEDLVIVQNDDGLFYIPGVINTLGDLVPGDGYMIFVDEAMDFIYPSIQQDIQGRTTTPLVSLAPVDPSLATGLPWNVLVHLDDRAQSLATTVQLLDGQRVVGQGVVQHDLTFTPVTAWEGAPDVGLSGFTSGHAVDLRLLDASGQQLPVELVGKDVKFGEGAYGVMSVASTELPQSFMVGKGYPNPFNPSMTVPIRLPEAGSVELQVVNVLGRTLFKETVHMKAGEHRYQFSAKSVGQDMVSGVYFLQVRFQGQQQVQKIVLMK
ncbi:S8 family serine peptidase [bacterium]|nr:S8 family serine peptidase [bacterium]